MGRNKVREICRKLSVPLLVLSPAKGGLCSGFSVLSGRIGTALFERKRIGTGE